MKAHGGYLCRLEALDARVLHVARKALEAEGERRSGISLCVSAIPRRRVVRIAFEAPHLTARWYEAHHALPRLLSCELNVTVHSYVLVPHEFEQVAAYGAGRHVGGERLRYDDVDIPGCGEGLDDAAFEKLRARWPLGHLAYVFGVTRDALLRLPWQEGVRIPFDGNDAIDRLARVLPPSPA